MNLVKKMVGAGYKLLGMPYYIVLWILKNAIKILKEATNYLAKAVEMTAGLVIKIIKTLWKVLKTPIPWSWKQIKKLNQKQYLFG